MEIMRAFLDASDNVVALARSDVTLEQAQAKLPSIVRMIVNAPDGLRYKPFDDSMHGTYHRLTSGDGTHLVDYTVQTDLVPLKKQAAVLIQKKAEETLNASTFDYSGYSFTTDSVSREYWTALFNARTVLSYPYSVLSFALQSVSLANATAVANLYQAYALKIKAIQDAVNTIKAQIIAATTEEQIQAIVRQYQ